MRGQFCSEALGYGIGPLQRGLSAWIRVRARVRVRVTVRVAVTGIVHIRG